MPPEQSAPSSERAKQRARVVAKTCPYTVGGAHQTMQARLWIDHEQVQLHRRRFDMVQAQFHATHPYTPAIGRHKGSARRFEQACIQVAGVTQYHLPLYANTIRVFEFHQETPHGPTA